VSRGQLRSRVCGQERTRLHKLRSCGALAGHFHQPCEIALCLRLVAALRGRLRGAVVATQALGLAQALGLDDEFGDALIDRIRESLANALDTPGLCVAQLLNIAAVAQAMGFDDLADQALSAAGSASSDCICDDLIKKTLANFGLNECRF